MNSICTCMPFSLLPSRTNLGAQWMDGHDNACRLSISPNDFFLKGNSPKDLAWFLLFEISSLVLKVGIRNVARSHCTCRQRRTTNQQPRMQLPSHRSVLFFPLDAHVAIYVSTHQHCTTIFFFLNCTLFRRNVTARIAIFVWYL